MSLPLTPESIAALYQYLCALPPFSALKMPDADDVEFWIIKDRCFASWQDTGKHHRISISSLRVGSSLTLLASLGHEMCHLVVSDSRQNTGGNENTHNSAFRKLAARFCKIHGLDLKAF